MSGRQDISLKNVETVQLESIALLPWEEEQHRYEEICMKLLESSSPSLRKAPTFAEEQREVVLVAPVNISRGYCNANVMASIKKLATSVYRFELQIARLCFKISQPH